MDSDPAYLEKLNLQLFEAVEQKDLDKVKSLISKGASVDATNSEKKTIFKKMLGISEYIIEREAIISYLIEQGANITTIGPFGGSLLHEAVGANMYSMTKLLLKKGIDHNIVSDVGTTAIFHANTVEMLELLINNNAGNLEDIDEDGNTLLHNAAGLKPNFELVEYLSKKIPIDSKNNDGNTPLINILNFDYFPKEVEEVVFLLIANGANVNAIGNSGRSAFLIAVMNKNLKLSVIKALVNAGANVNLKDKFGLQALHLSAARNSEYLKYLLEAESDVNELTNDFQTPLIFATQYNQKRSVQYLLAKNALVNIKDSTGKTALNYAIEEDFSDIVAMLLAEQAVSTSEEELQVVAEEKKYKLQREKQPTEIANINDAIAAKNLSKVRTFYRNKNSQENLKKLVMLTLRKGDLEIFKYFISQGYDIRKTFEDGYTALHFAVFFNQIDIARYLIANKLDINAVSKDKRTVFTLSSNSSVEMVELLLAANVMPHKEFDSSIVNDTIYYRKPVVAQHLIKLGYKFNPEILADENILIKVIVNSSISTMQLLIERGLDLEIKIPLYGDEGTLLHQAIILEKKEMALFLIKEGANPNARNSDNKPIFKDAVNLGNLDILTAMYDHNGNLEDTTPPFENTPLHLALELKRVKIARLLIKKGANVNQKNKRMDTPIHLAAEHGYLDTIKLMKEHDGQLDIKNNWNKTPLDIAIKENQKAVEEYLSLVNDL